MEKVSRGFLAGDSYGEGIYSKQGNFQARLSPGSTRQFFGVVDINLQEKKTALSRLEPLEIEKFESFASAKVSQEVRETIGTG
ncbi:hypothetical protein ACU8KH_01135 [Lachancea thermotolerans]